MFRYEIKSIGSDYGIFLDKKLITHLIFNKLDNAKKVKEILEMDIKQQTYTENNDTNFTKEDLELAIEMLLISAKNIVKPHKDKMLNSEELGSMPKDTLLAIEKVEAIVKLTQKFHIALTKEVPE